MSTPRVKGSIANGTSADRCPDDFYATPKEFVRELLRREKFSETVWEPAAGDGAIGDVLVESGYRVIETDLTPRHPRVVAVDFLTQTTSRGADIITNPPFKLMCEFLEKSWELAHRKFALVMPISGLNSSRRYKAAWGHMPVSSIYLAPRYQHIRSDRGVIPSQFTHIWVVVDREHLGPAQFHWLPNVVYSGSIDINNIV
jgi:hypothetical protein